MVVKIRLSFCIEVSVLEGDNDISIVSPHLVTDLDELQLDLGQGSFAGTEEGVILIEWLAVSRDEFVYCLRGRYLQATRPARHSPSHSIL